VLWLSHARRLFDSFEPRYLEPNKSEPGGPSELTSWIPGVPVGVALSSIMAELSSVSIEGRAQGQFESLCSRCFGDGLCVPHDSDDIEREPCKCPKPVTSSIGDTGDYATDCGCDRVPCPACDKGRLASTRAELAGCRRELEAVRNVLQLMAYSQVQEGLVDLVGLALHGDRPQAVDEILRQFEAARDEVERINRECEAKRQAENSGGASCVTGK
jgi:hypothetical protein